MKNQIVFVLLAISVAAGAQQIPNVLQDGAIISAQELNDNFDALVPTCPTGFVEVTSQGTIFGCIQQSEYPGSATWHTAMSNCIADYEGRLPTQAEWLFAVSTLTLTDEIDAWEWAADASGNSHQLVGNTSTTDESSVLSSNTQEYRCWIDK